MPRSTTARRSAGTLLNAEEATRRRINAAVAQGIDNAVARVAEKRKEERQRRAAMLALLLMIGPAMVGMVRSAILQGRRGARQVATKRLQTELAAAGVALTAHDLGAMRPLVVASQADRHDDDGVHAQASAESLVTQWRGLAIYTMAMATRNGDDEVAALAKTKRLMATRIVRTAASETAHAYNDEHHHALQDAIRYDDRIERELAEAEIVAEWSALIDACEMCWPHHGEQVAIGDSYRGGAFPGSMHPHCRCTEIYTTARLGRLAA